MSFVAHNGEILDDAAFDARAREYEEGTWSGVSEVSAGRPKMYDEDMETVSFRLPKSRMSAIEAHIGLHGGSKSQFFRDAIDEALLAHA